MYTKIRYMTRYTLNKKKKKRHNSLLTINTKILQKYTHQNEKNITDSLPAKNKTNTTGRNEYESKG